MRAFTSIVAFLLLFLATSNASPRGHDDHHDCVSDDEAAFLLKSWISFFEKIDTKLANKVIADGFTEFSSSLNFIEGLNFDAITYPDKATFIAGQVNATAAGSETFTVIDTFHVCDRLVFNWKDNSTPIPLTGMDIIYFQKAKSGKFQIIKGVSEFNNAAVLFNAGVFPCPTTPAAPAATA